MMASNESPDPPLPAVVEAVTRVLGTLNRYPDPSNSRLRAALSDRYGVPAARIAIGNGSCEILMAAGEALLEPGAELVYAWPSFSVYPHLAAASGATEIRVPLDADERHDLAAMAQEITVATRLAIVCNPNNPTSTALPLDEIAAFIAEVPRHVAVILDEAYCEFNTLDDPDASLDLLAKHPNLVLLRTFSKIYGLCGLRVGFALCGSEDFVRAVNQVRQPFFCNAAAQAAAIEALRHQDAVAERVERADGRARRDRGGARVDGHLVAPSRRRTSRGSTCRCPRARRPRRRGRRRARAGRARRHRARGRRARQARCAARDLRDAGAEPALPRRAARAGLTPPAASMP